MSLKTEGDVFGSRTLGLLIFSMITSDHSHELVSVTQAHTRPCLTIFFLVLAAGDVRFVHELTLCLHLASTFLLRSYTDLRAQLSPHLIDSPNLPSLFWCPVPSWPPIFILVRSSLPCFGGFILLCDCDISNY